MKTWSPPNGLPERPAPPPAARNQPSRCESTVHGLPPPHSLRRKEIMILSPRRLLVAAGITATLASSAWLAAGRADANTATSAASERSQAVKYVIDPVHSAAIFGIEWQDMTPFYGQFTSFSGSVTWDGKDPKTFSCDVTIPVESVDSHAEG